MKIGSFPPEHNANFVAAMIPIIRGMQRLMNVRHQMNQKTERLGANRPRELRVTKDPCGALDLSNNTVTVPTIPVGVVAGASNRNIDKMPRGAFWTGSPDVIGPG